MNCWIVICAVLVFLQSEIVNSQPACSDRLELFCRFYNQYCTSTVETVRTIMRQNCAQTCNFCTISGSWGPWIIGQCGASCGHGIRRDTRQCNENNCVGSNFRVVACFLSECRPTGVWSDWSFGECSVTCGEGTRSDNRICINGNNCIGQSTRIRPCSLPACQAPRCRDEYIFCNLYKPYCAVTSITTFLRNSCQFTCPRFCRTSQGVWSEWVFGQCSVTCGGGIRTDTRTCQPMNSCTGSPTRQQNCNERRCPSQAIATTTRPTVPPDSPTYTAWTNDGTCSVTCGDGLIRQTRICIRGTCDAQNLTRFIACNNGACNAVIGVWGAWTQWGTCNGPCGGGKQTRTRTCTTSSCLGNTNTLRRYCNPSPSRCTGRDVCSRSCGNGTFFSTSRNSYSDCNNGPCPRQECPDPFWENRYGFRSHECCDRTNIAGGDCGVAANQGRIINGRPTTVTNWPWMVQIRTAQSFCGGVVVSRNYVVTAAHCVRNQNLNSITIAIGVNLRRDDVTNRTARRVLIHPSFNQNTFANDIALIQLNTPVEVNFINVRSLCLPQGERIPNDLECIVAGWGTTSNSGFPRNTVLNEVGVRILPIEICNSAYGNVDENLMICAGRVDGAVDSCLGDSGGPLMCQRCSSCAWFLAGVTSFGGNLCAVQNEPGVYSRVSSLESWIYQQQTDIRRPVALEPSCT